MDGRRLYAMKSSFELKARLCIVMFYIGTQSMRNSTNLYVNLNSENGKLTELKYNLANREILSVKGVRRVLTAKN